MGTVLLMTLSCRRAEQTGGAPETDRRVTFLSNIMTAFGFTGRSPPNIDGDLTGWALYLARLEALLADYPRMASAAGEASPHLAIEVPLGWEIEPDGGVMVRLETDTRVTVGVPEGDFHGTIQVIVRGPSDVEFRTLLALGSHMIDPSDWLDGLSCCSEPCLSGAVPPPMVAASQPAT